MASLPAWEGWDESAPQEDSGDSGGGCGGGHGSKPNEAALRSEFESRLLEEARRSFETGRERGREEGRTTERDAASAAQATAAQQRAVQAAELVESFCRERDRYLQAVEHEVVKLALAVASRILRREAQMDPLLLTGVVRVALGQLSAATEVRLRVPEAELGLWREVIDLLPNLPVKPVVTAGERMSTGDCAIETELGAVDLGIRSQLIEIERGFFDRTAGSRPAARTRGESSPRAERETRI